MCAGWKGVDAQPTVFCDECCDVGVRGEDVRGGGGGGGVVGGAVWVRRKRRAEEERWGGGGKHFGFLGAEVWEMVWFWGATGDVYGSSHLLEDRVTVRAWWAGYQTVHGGPGDGRSIMDWVTVRPW